MKLTDYDKRIASECGLTVAAQKCGECGRAIPTGYDSPWCPDCNSESVWYVHEANGEVKPLTFANECAPKPLTAENLQRAIAEMKELAKSKPLFLKPTQFTPLPPSAFPALFQERCEELLRRHPPCCVCGKAPKLVPVKSSPFVDEYKMRVEYACGCAPDLEAKRDNPLMVTTKCWACEAWALAVEPVSCPQCNGTGSITRRATPEEEREYEAKKRPTDNEVLATAKQMLREQAEAILAIGSPAYKAAANGLLLDTLPAVVRTEWLEKARKRLMGNVLEQPDHQTACSLCRGSRRIEYVSDMLHAEVDCPACVTSQKPVEPPAPVEMPTLIDLGNDLVCCRKHGDSLWYKSCPRCEEESTPAVGSREWAMAKMRADSHVFFFDKNGCQWSHAGFIKSHPWLKVSTDGRKEHCPRVPEELTSGWEECPF